MRQKVTIWVVICALLLVFGAICFAQTNEQCLMCHSNKTLTKKITFSNGTTETIPLFVDKDKFTANKHGGLQCVQCHTDINTANVFSHTGTNSLAKTYGGWARFSAKNDTVTAGKERTRNYYTAASMSCNKGGCHTKMAAFDTSGHHVAWRLKNAHIRTVNGESVGEEYQKNDCARCHTTCATCHFKTTKSQAMPGNVVALWDSLQNFGDTGALARATKMTEYAMDWTTNIESHTIFTDDSLKASNTVCQSCHSGYYKPPASGFLSEEPPYPKAMATNIKRHPQVQESAQSSKHQGVTCATCHSDVHSYPGRNFDWQKEGDARCQKCHQVTNHYSQHKTVDCIACHFTGFAKSKGQAGHDVWRLNNKPDGRVRPLAVKYNEAMSWYPHNIVKPNQAICASRCHYEGNLLGATVFPASVIDITGVPNTFTLKQNYPNPFNPHTNINFTLPNQKLVEIQIYDVLGNWVTTILHQNLDAGNHQVTWNGQDQNGTELASGIYVVTIKADKFSASKKMLKLK